MALAKQVLGLAGLVICQTNNTATMLKCLLHELVPALSYFFLVLCSLAPRNLKRSLNVFLGLGLGLGLGLEGQVLVNNTAVMLSGGAAVQSVGF